jgi:hypothetical protein
VTEESHGNHRRAVARFRADLEGPERDNEAVRLYHAERLTWQEVADRLGFSRRRDAQRAAERSLSQARAVSTREMIAEVLAAIEGDDPVAARIVHGPKRHKTSVTGKIILGPGRRAARGHHLRSSRRSWSATSSASSGWTCPAWRRRNDQRGPWSIWTASSTP